MELLKTNVPNFMKQWVIDRAKRDNVSLSDVIRSLIQKEISHGATKNRPAQQ